MGTIKRWEILLIIPLLFGCTIDYRCDAGPPCELDTPMTDFQTEATAIQLGTKCDLLITVDWPEGELEAEVACDEMYNNTPKTQDRCTCVKDN